MLAKVAWWASLDDVWNGPLALRTERSSLPQCQPEDRDFYVTPDTLFWIVKARRRSAPKISYRLKGASGARYAAISLTRSVERLPLIDAFSFKVTDTAIASFFAGRYTMVAA
jgi:hypothetical protein